eukprot:TRINITY_DN3322_c1_g7_i1.p1 TRINITY_DN3322_c1_g7~~TRINITY_DN3322_c1_g7_i1.p1  ORF type:complete len:114 (+),score=14.13 TRINITY_DN3322_c1_g7_i1:228-569(+)
MRIIIVLLCFYKLLMVFIYFVIFVVETFVQNEKCALNSLINILFFFLLLHSRTFFKSLTSFIIIVSEIESFKPKSTEINKSSSNLFLTFYVLNNLQKILLFNQKKREKLKNRC